MNLPPKFFVLVVLWKMYLLRRWELLLKREEAVFFEFGDMTSACDHVLAWRPNML